MADFTIFLRNLAQNTAAREQELAALPDGIVPVMGPEIGIPPLEVPVIAGGSDGSREGTLPLGVDGPLGGRDSPPPIAASHAEGGNDDGAAAAAVAPPPARDDAEEVGSGPAPALHGSGQPSIAVDAPAGEMHVAESVGDAVIIPARDEVAPLVVPLMNRRHLEPPPVANNAVAIRSLDGMIAPAAVFSMDPLRLALSPPPVLVVAPRVENSVHDDDGAAAAHAAVPPLAEAAIAAAPSASAMRDSAPHAVDIDLPADDPAVAEAVNHAINVAAPDDTIAAPAGRLMEGVHRVSPSVSINAGIPDLAESIAPPPQVPSTEPMHLESSPPVVVVAPLTEQAEHDDDGAAAVAHAAMSPQADAAIEEEASSSAMRMPGPAPPRVADPPLNAEPADVRAEPAIAAGVTSLEEEIARRENLNPLLLRPFPGSPAQVMATYVACTLRTPLGGVLGMANIPQSPVVAARAPVGQAYYRGGGGSGGGSGGGGGVGGREGVGEVRAKGEGWWKWWRARA